MSTTLTVITIVSWLALLFMIFLYERLDRRLAALTVLTERLLHGQRGIMGHMGVLEREDAKVAELRRMIQEGKVLEAQAAYRAWSGVTFKEARIYIDTLMAEQSVRQTAD